MNYLELSTQSNDNLKSSGTEREEPTNYLELSTQSNDNLKTSGTYELFRVINTIKR